MKFLRQEYSRWQIPENRAFRARVFHKKTHAKLTFGERVQVENPATHSSKCYLTVEGRGIISCPSCGFGRAFDFRENMPVSRNVIVRCKCGRNFKTFLEVRQHYRKTVKLLGKYTNLTTRSSGQMIVEDLSRIGIGLRIIGGVYFEKEDLVEVAFELDNAKNSLIVFKGAVRHILKNFVGCRILEILQGRKELGFYLLP